jgi:hypothetical protein
MLVFLGSFSRGQQHVSSIVFHGHQKTKGFYLEKLISTELNKPLDSLRVAQDILRLVQTPAINHAYYQVKKSHDGQLELHFYLEENRTLIPAVDLWQTLNNQFAFHLGLKNIILWEKDIPLVDFIA